MGRDPDSHGSGSEPADAEDQDTADRVGRVAADDDLDTGETGAEARSDDG
ncbi:hypothetical protein [Mycolicibacillus trivialis]|nr:hypothetical protein [Mycolicibacillus trivialis]